MEHRLALLISSSGYQDPTLSQLITPQVDVEAFANVLRDPKIGNFEHVSMLSNEPSYTIREAIAEFFSSKKRDDLLLLYFSGHGVLDINGRLYLATVDTKRTILRASAVSAHYITDEMDNSRSRRQILMLDCCHSGAFARGSKGVIGASVGTGEAFKGMGYGRIVLTASDATQYAWEGEQIKGDKVCSVFTHFIVEGLRTGAADLLQNGRITIDELYDYAYGKIIQLDSDKRQTPGKWSYKQQGEIVIALNPHQLVKPTSLPVELQHALENPFAGIREGAAHELNRLLYSNNQSISLEAYNALKQMLGDDSRQVSKTVTNILSTYDEKKAESKEAKVKTKKPVADEAKLEKRKNKSEDKLADSTSITDETVFEKPGSKAEPDAVTSIITDEIKSKQSKYERSVESDDIASAQLPVDIIPDGKKTLPLALGIETLGGIFTKLLNEGSVIPQHCTEIFTTAADNQSSIEIHILQGFRPLAKDNLTVGKFHLKGISPAPKGVPQIEVGFDIDANGILRVQAIEIETGKKQEIEVSNVTNIDDATVKHLLMEAKKGDASPKEKPDDIKEKPTDMMEELYIDLGWRLVNEHGHHIPQDIFEATFYEELQAGVKLPFLYERTSHPATKKPVIWMKKIKKSKLKPASRLSNGKDISYLKEALDEAGLSSKDLSKDLEDFTFSEWVQYTKDIGSRLFKPFKRKK